MKYQINDQINGPQIFDTEAEAQAALGPAQAAFLAREDYRFSFSTVIVEGANTTWRNPLPEDPEEGNYHVFNHYTGLYEPFLKKSQAQARLNALKQNFLVDVALDKVYEYVPPPAAPVTIPTAVL